MRLELPKPKEFAVDLDSPPGFMEKVNDYIKEHNICGWFVDFNNGVAKLSFSDIMHREMIMTEFGENVITVYNNEIK